MNVNNGESDRPKKRPAKRIRRTPQEARAQILAVAKSRLGRSGLEGLNIAGVAREAGMSHATVIHHFGSTGAMREALLKSMTTELLTDVMDALTHHESPERVLDRLFTALSRDGHGRLLAWLALDRQLSGFDTGGESTRLLFTGIIDTLEAEGLTRADARHQVFLVAVAALGLGISGDLLAQLLGMEPEDLRNFPGWLADHLQKKGSV